MNTALKTTGHGKMVETNIEFANGKKCYTITTMKRCSGNVATVMRIETIEGDYKVFTYGDGVETLAYEKIRATEKNLLRQHNDCLKTFLAVRKNTI